MKKPIRLALVLLPLLASSLFAADAPTPAVTSWHAQTLLSAIGNVLIFAGIGIVAAIIGFKLFDLCTPGNWQKEIVENKNVAAAIVAGAVILGICLIIAASILG